MLDLEPYHLYSKHLSKNNTGLGNVLYQISAIFAICKKYNITFNAFSFNKYILKLKELGLNHGEKIFRNIDLSVKEEKVDIKLSQKHSHIYSHNLIEDIIKYKEDKILIKNSYFQSVKYFIDYEKDIQDMFSPDKKFIKRVRKMYSKLFMDNQSNICVHMRLNWGKNIKLDPNFILKAVKFLEKSNFVGKNINLWVFSDNIKKAKKILSSIKKYNKIYVESNKYDYEDLWMMSLIKNHIVSFSTFSWWGAFLNKNPDKKIIYSSDFSEFFCKKVIKKKQDPVEIQENAYPADWICLNYRYVYQ